MPVRWIIDNLVLRVDTAHHEKPRLYPSSRESATRSTDSQPRPDMETTRPKTDRAAVSLWLCGLQRGSRSPLHGLTPIDAM